MRRFGLMSIEGGGEGGGGGGEGGGEGGGTASWRDGLDAGIKEHPALADFADVPALAESFLATKEMVGRKGIILPKEDDAGDLVRFRTEIGVPASAEDYELGDFKPPEGVPWSPDFQTAMLRRLHTIGIPNGQIREILDGHAEETAVQYATLTKTAAQGQEQGVAKLKEELGVDYEASRALAESSFKAASGKDFDELSHLVLADGTHIGDNPAFVRTFINIGNQYKEAGLHGDKFSGGGYTLTPQAALDEIAKLESNDAWKDADHPEHKMIVDKMDDLYKQAYPEQVSEVPAS